MVAMLVSVAHSQAQTTAPTTTPAASPAASPGPINPALYLPQAATVQVAGTGGSTTSATARVGTARTATNATSTPPVQSLQVSSPDLFSPTALAAQPQPVTITLTYNVACAGATVLVAPLDGGTVNQVGGGASQTAGAQQITVGADGTLAFSFQAPAGPGRYHVITRLGGVEMALPFDVPASGN